ncbi:hypothetical protein [Paenibacillus sp. QZ-Y1]|uniref:hypothetical protein n=1 Tax=Paenibacillus sp. QZ-Y1 TaxID=3414511 RepID=UPI003F7AE342
MQTGMWKEANNDQEAQADDYLFTRIRQDDRIGWNEEVQQMVDITLMKETTCHMVVGRSRVRSQSVTHLNIWPRLLIGLIIIFGLGTIYFSSAADAAGIDLGVTAQKAWDTVLNKADAQTQLNLQRAYENVGNWKTQEQDWTQKIKTIHAANIAELERLRVEIRQTDDAKITGLSEKVKQTQARYEPLFTLYSSVNRQLDAAKAIKNKEWSAAIRTQAETLKPVVKLAREDIRIKKKELAEARKRKKAEVKRLRAMLAGADSVKKQIQTTKKQVSVAKERYSNALQQFKQSMKQGQTSRVLSSLNSLGTAAEKWAGSKQNIHTLEQKVSTTYVKVRQELANRPK